MKWEGQWGHRTVVWIFRYWGGEWRRSREKKVEIVVRNTMDERVNKRKVRELLVLKGEGNVKQSRQRLGKRPRHMGGGGTRGRTTEISFYHLGISGRVGFNGWRIRGNGKHSRAPFAEGGKTMPK